MDRRVFVVGSMTLLLVPLGVAFASVRHVGGIEMPASRAGVRSRTVAVLVNVKSVQAG